MSDVSTWNVSAGSNNASPPDGAPESSTLVPQLNDIIREGMAATARWYGDTDGTLVTAGSGNAFTLTTNSTPAALADQSMLVFRADRANTGAATLQVNALAAKPLVIKGGQALESGNITANQIVMAVYNSSQDRYEIALVGSGVTAADLSSSALGFALVNGTLSASVASNALTIAIKTLAGNDPGASDPVFALFRHATLSNGLFVVRSIQTATSLLIPLGATLGASNNTAFRLWITLHDDAGTVRLGVSNRAQSTGIAPIPEAAKSTTTLVSAGAGSAAVFYTATAVTAAAPLLVAGYIDFSSGLATAGTWNIGPDVIQLKGHGTPLPGQTIQAQQTMVTNTTADVSGPSFADITGMSVAINLQGAPNQVLVQSMVSVGAPTARKISLRLVRGTTNIGVGDAAGSRTRGTTETTSVDGGDDLMNAAITYIDAPGAAGLTSYKLQYKTESGFTVSLNKSFSDADLVSTSRCASSLICQEIMG